MYILVFNRHIFFLIRTGDTTNTRGTNRAGKESSVTRYAILYSVTGGLRFVGHGERTFSYPLCK